MLYVFIALLSFFGMLFWQAGKMQAVSDAHKSRNKDLKA